MMKTRLVLKVMVLTSALALSSMALADTTSITTTTSGTTTPATSNAIDASIIAGIRSKIAADATTSGLNVQVNSQNGVVTLSGTVNTDAEADKVIQIAQSTSGVKDVETNQLTVKESKNLLSDTAITAKVKGMYIREKLFGDKDISVMGVSVETTNGVVYLSGKVESQSQATNAVKLAKAVQGVKKVESKLEVMPAG